MSEKGAGSVAGCYDVMAGGRAAGVAERVIRIRPEVGEGRRIGRCWRVPPRRMLKEIQGQLVLGPKLQSYEGDRHAFSARQVPGQVRCHGE